MRSGDSGFGTDGHGLMSDLSPLCATKQTLARAAYRPVEGREIKTVADR
jgi:hypothetical protein